MELKIVRTYYKDGTEMSPNYKIKEPSEISELSELINKVYHRVKYEYEKNNNIKKDADDSY